MQAAYWRDAQITSFAPLQLRVAVGRGSLCRQRDGRHEVASSPLHCAHQLQDGMIVMMNGMTCLLQLCFDLQPWHDAMAMHSVCSGIYLHV